MSFFAEVRRRNVFKVGAAYAIVGWLLAQLAGFATETFGAPAWALQTFVVFLVLGLPVALILSWAYEITPQGLRTTGSVQSEQSVTHATGQRLNFIILGLLVLAVSFLVVDQYLFDEGMQASVAGAGIPLPSNADREALMPTQSGSSQVVRSYIDLVSEEAIGDTGLSAHIALSRDGRYLTYAAQRGGQTQLYLRELSQFDTQAIAGTEGAFHPFFSPDGEWVGFFTEQTSNPNLKKVYIRGGLPQYLADTFFSSGGDWGRDNYIIYGTGSGAMGRSLFRISAAGGTPEDLITSDAQNGYVSPELLPGGEELLMVVRSGQGGAGNARDGRVAVMSLATREMRTLIEGAFAPRYAPTGHIVFVRNSTLWAVPFDVTVREKTGPEVPVLQGVQNDGFRGAASYAFSDDGLLAYVSGTDTLITGNVRQLVWVDRDGQAEPVAAEQRAYLFPRFSPNNERLAITIVDAGSQDVWVLDLTRGTLSRLTFDPAVDLRPLWTPDGERIVFWSARDGGGLFWKDADGTGPASLLIAGAEIRYPESISPDGSQLVVRQEGESTDLFLLSLTDDPVIQPLLQTMFDEGGAAISPDGAWIAYESNETGRYEIYVRPFPNVNDGKWQVSTAGGEEAVWAKDGAELFYRDLSGAIVAVSVEIGSNVSAGSPRLITRGAYADRELAGTPSYDISSDGLRFVVMTVGGESVGPVETQLHLVHNWFEELEQLSPTR